jgi:hypothetical protein
MPTIPTTVIPQVHHYPFQGPSISPIPSCSSSSPPVSSSLVHLAASRAFSPLTPMIASSSALPSISSISGSPKSDILASKVSRYYIHNDVEAESADSEVQHSKRYSLRVRQAKQIKPYQYDKVFYQRQMRSNPDAIVNIVDTSGHQPKDQYQPKGETQADVSHQWERPRIVRRDVGHQECVHNTAWYPKALDGCSSSEDETNRETRGLAKEARRIRKQLKQNTEKERKKPKHFPLSERFMSTRTYNDGGWSDIETPLSDESSSRINVCRISFCFDHYRIMIFALGCPHRYVFETYVHAGKIRRFTICV